MEAAAFLILITLSAQSRLFDTASRMLFRSQLERNLTMAFPAVLSLVGLLAQLGLHVFTLMLAPRQRRDQQPACS
ncbi:hypothetical protein [Cyanobium gracile]|uniref:Uncharacterized protein n=1 Tax=Cyanobium gracile UHCC 0281 TaxID=3110309 RepID=A0ABU5SZC0_9CYAN|nr:hypothetical protein [Cyanobium gracile]MEA5443732.1 hypothetical protein [Cyanobium gracile UHCC 0281]